MFTLLRCVGCFQAFSHFGFQLLHRFKLRNSEKCIILLMICTVNIANVVFKLLMNFIVVLTHFDEKLTKEERMTKFDELLTIFIFGEIFKF